MAKEWIEENCKKEGKEELDNIESGEADLMNFLKNGRVLCKILPMRDG